MPRAIPVGLFTRSIARRARIDVTRGTRKDPTRAFWMPFVSDTAGDLTGILGACGPGSESLCGPAGITLGGIPGLVYGTWRGLRSAPRWVTVAIQ